MRPFQGAFRKLPVLAVLAALSLGGCEPSRGLEALALLDDLSAGPSADHGGQGVRREAITYRVDGRLHQGDFYHTADIPNAPLVLVPGAAVEGKDSPLLVALAGSLARARFAVLVPDIANVRQLKVSAADALEVGAAIRASIGANRRQRRSRRWRGGGFLCGRAGTARGPETAGPRSHALYRRRRRLLRP